MVVPLVNPEQLQLHAERIRASGVLGRSELLARLFNFFVDCSLKNHVPKEIEVALDVFGKRADFDVAQDAVVRVYIHKLRRKLEEYYQGLGKDDTGRLVIPKGEYRFVWQDRSEPTVEPEPEITEQELQGETELALETMASQARVPRWRRWWPFLVVALLVLNAALLLGRWHADDTQIGLNRQVALHPFWAGVVQDTRPLYLVVGDYYIFGELDDNSMEVQRMVRDFDINSPTDLEQYLKNNPQLAARYMDMSLQYLPTSVAFALRDVMPLLQESASGRQIQVILASDLTPTMAKSADVVYIGLLSGMGLLKQMVFENSPLQVGDSFDELVDPSSGKHFVSQASVVPDAKSSYRDFGFVYSRARDDGSHLLVLSGTRDVALLHVAETLTQRDGVQALVKAANTTSNFEAVYAVQALDRTNLNGELLLTRALNSSLLTQSAQALGDSAK